MRHWIAIGFVLSACSGDGGTPDSKSGADAPLVIDGPVDARPGDGPPADAPLASLTCKELSDRALPLMNALDRTCNGDDDCEIVNLPTISPDCDRMHILGGNDRAARKGWTSADLTALRTEFAARCQSDTSCGSNNPCIADWRPPLASCASHSCVAVLQSCLPPPPDAGP